jgi:hypothetical protein
VEQTRIDAIIVAYRYSAKNRAIFAISFLPDYDHILSALSQVLWHHFSLPRAAMLIYQNIRPTEASCVTRLNKITFQTYAQVSFLQA